MDFFEENFENYQFRESSIDLRENQWAGFEDILETIDTPGFKKENQVFSVDRSTTPLENVYNRIIDGFEGDPVYASLVTLLLIYGAILSFKRIYDGSRNRQFWK